jgi:hypothetical protein
MGAPDEFHPDAHLDAREITGEWKYGEWGQCIATAKSAGRRCRGYAQGPHGKCSTHGGSDDSGAPEGNTNAEGNDGGAPEENTNAADHGGYSDKFLDNFVGPDGKERIEDGYDLAEDPEGAQKQALLMAQVALEKFRVTGDERFLRRYESICDTFGIAPADELEAAADAVGDLASIINNET